MIDYNVYQCTRCKHYKLDAKAKLGVEGQERWYEMGWCKHFKEKVIPHPKYTLKHAPPYCEGFKKRGKRGIASMK